MNIQELQQIYRNQNIRAFLRAIRLGEGTSGQDGYSIIVGGDHFTDFSAHPRKSVYLENYGIWSTAAGAYQFIFPTWNALRARYGFSDFSPGNQDLAAVALIRDECHAVDDIMAGRLQDAIRKCSTQWASLPGSRAGQRTEMYANIEEEFIGAGGVLA